MGAYLSGNLSREKGVWIKSGNKKEQLSFASFPETFYLCFPKNK